MNFISPPELSPSTQQQWCAFDLGKKVTHMQNWIACQQPLEKIAPWVECSAPNEQSVLLSTPIALGKLFPSHYFQSCNWDHIISLQNYGFEMSQYVPRHTWKELVWETRHSATASKILKSSTPLFHLCLFKALCNNISNQTAGARVKWMMAHLDFSSLVKNCSQELLDTVSSCALLSFGKPKRWTMLLEIVDGIPNMPMLVKRRINFPKSSKWFDGVGLYAAAFELWGGQCIVSARKSVLLPAFEDHLKFKSAKISPELEACLRAFFLHDHLTSQIQQPCVAERKPRKM